MKGFIEELIDKAKKSKIFKRNKKSLELKILAGLLYFFRLSLRKTSLFMSLFEELSQVHFEGTEKEEKEVDCSR